MFKFHCPHCQQKISADVSQSGISAQCPTCGGDFIVPTAAEAMGVESTPLTDTKVENPTRPPEESTAQECEVNPEPRPSHTVSERLKERSKMAKEGAKVLKDGAMAGWAGLRRRSKQAALRAQIEKLRNIDLRKALHALGKDAFEQCVLATELAAHFHAIRELDCRISEMREKAVADSGETKMAALKRVSKDTAKASHAQVLAVKREHLITELGREIHARKAQMSAHDMCEKWNVISDIDQRIRKMGDEIRELDDKGQSHSSASDLDKAFSINRLIPLFVCCLLFGWGTGGFLGPDRLFISSSIIGQIIPVAMLGVPSLILAIMGICHFVRPFQFPTKKAIGVLFFTMLFGVAGLLIFQSIADYALHHPPKGLTRFVGFIALVVVVIGEAYQLVNDPSSNILQQFFGFIFGVGFCEEVTKLLPLFFLARTGDDRRNKIDFRSFLVVAFFSGLGFGIGEAVYAYAPWSGNSNPAVSSNVLRWFACVPSHAIYTVIDACFLWLLFPEIIAARNNYIRFAICALTVLAVAVLHGSYNVLSSLPYLGLVMDAASIFLMYYVVVWVAKRTGDAETIQQHEKGASTGILGWLKNSKAGRIRFGRIYVACPIMIAGTLLFADKDPTSSDLSWCSEHGDLEGVKGFLTSANINGNGDQTPPLHLAAKGGQIKVADFLISQGAGINQPDSYLTGWTPVHYAASSGQTEMIAYLLEKGAKIDKVDENGEYPIHTAARYGHIDAMKVLMHAGSKPDQKSEPKRIRNYGLAEDWTESADYQPIHSAARGNQQEVIRFLIGLGISPETKDANGNDALHYATSFMGWRPSRAETIRLVDKNGEFERAAANTISTDGYYVTDESPPRFIRFMPEEPMIEGKSRSQCPNQRAVISFGPRGGTSPREVAKWLYPYNEEATKQGKFISGTYQVMKGYVNITSFDSTYEGGDITLSRNHDPNKLKLLLWMRSGRDAMQDFFPDSEAKVEPGVECKFVSWK